jgi:hypothetical protein
VVGSRGRDEGFDFANAAFEKTGAILRGSLKGQTDRIAERLLPGRDEDLRVKSRRFIGGCVHAGR